MSSFPAFSRFFRGLSKLNSFANSFFQPVAALIPGARNFRSCPEISDPDFVALCVRRALEHVVSGREFIQKLAFSDSGAPLCSSFFECLKSSRRRDLITEVSSQLLPLMPIRQPEAWSSIPELNLFDVYAGDGHYHEAAAHDPRHGENQVKVAVPHFFSLNLRTHEGFSVFRNLTY